FATGRMPGHAPSVGTSDNDVKQADGGAGGGPGIQPMYRTIMEKIHGLCLPVSAKPPPGAPCPVGVHGIHAAGQHPCCAGLGRRGCACSSFPAESMTTLAAVSGA